MNLALNSILKNARINFRRRYCQYGVVVLFAVALFLVNTLPYNIFTRMSYLGKVIIIFLLIILMFKIQSKIIFFISLCSLFITLLFLINGNQNASEAWATAVYSFFVFGIFASLFDNRKDFN